MLDKRKDASSPNSVWARMLGHMHMKCSNKNRSTSVIAEHIPPRLWQGRSPIQINWTVAIKDAFRVHGARGQPDIFVSPKLRHLAIGEPADNKVPRNLQSSPAEGLLERLVRTKLPDYHTLISSWLKRFSIPSLLVH